MRHEPQHIHNTEQEYFLALKIEINVFVVA